MEKSVFDDYVENRYRGQMKYYSQASAKNQKKYRQFQWILIILSALTPILAALNGLKFTDDKGGINWINNDIIQMLVIIISAVVAILTTGLKTFNYYELWVNYRTTYEKLKPEIYYYNFSVGPYTEPGVDKESLFVSRVESILDAEHTIWPPAKKLQEEQDKSKAEIKEDNQQSTATEVKPETETPKSTTNN